MSIESILVVACHNAHAQNHVLAALEDVFVLFKKPLDRWTAFPPGLKDQNTPVLYVLPPPSNSRGFKDRAVKQTVTESSCRPGVIGVAVCDQ